MSQYAADYLHKVIALITRVHDEQLPQLNQAAVHIADTLQAGGLLHVFGSGHSQLLAAELFYRAGGLVPVNAILDLPLSVMQAARRSTWLERVPGYAAQLLQDEPVRAGDTLIVISNSGRNAVPIEMALAAKAQGATVIALTSLSFSQSISSRHSSGQRLFEVADLVLDNYGVDGDALVAVPGCPVKVSASSTAVGSALLQAVAAATVAELAARGIEAPVWQSANGDEGEARNAAHWQAMHQRIKRL
ncbi:SIS domain-containing protein [Chitinibacter fontanus]|uniref:SIS domain-containing protein n=1 Tax=Chitinibacter fontanus TaxID=1737446 RepID=A0A7D5ZFJ4_9NEIS|nr:SIS domain-containing protein [Chitinibacter fontanus]QLI81568.1 SIS domain-containing protein [Chitinibacter fontanus]